MNARHLQKRLSRAGLAGPFLWILGSVALTFFLVLAGVFFFFIPSLQEQLMDQRREVVRNLTDTAWHILDQYEKQSRLGELSGAEAREAAAESIQSLRYGADGSGYFWLNDTHPRMIRHPYRPDLNGQDLSDFKDPSGHPLFLAFVEKVRADGAGYVDYLWQWKDDPNHIAAKTSYVRLFAPWDWIIGTGIYVEDVQEEIEAITRRFILLFLCLFGVVLAFSVYIGWMASRSERARQHSEEELRRSEERFRTLGEDAPFGITIQTKDQKFEYVNPQFTQIFGYTITDMPDKKAWFELAYPDEAYRTKVIQAWTQDYVEEWQPHESKPRMFTVRCKDGQDKIIQFRGVALKDGKQLMTYEDRTDQVRMEEALRNSQQEFRALYRESRQNEELYQSLLHSSADGIVVYDIQGRAQYVSPAFTRMFGWTMEEVAGKSIPFLPEEEREATMTIIRELLEKGTPCQGFETRRYTRDGRMVDVSISASRYDDGAGNRAGLLVILRDISEKKQLEAQIQQAQRMESIGTLAGGVAHDFNNLLMAIQGNASLLLLDKGSDHPDHQRIKNIEQCVRKGGNLTRQLLGFARKEKFQPSPTNINDLVKESSEMFSRTRKEVRIHSHYQKNLWPVEADQNQMKQVLLNLYVNAWQAMPEGGEIFLETENVILEPKGNRSLPLRPGRYVRIRVKDTGAGMEKAVQSRIFDPFFSTKEVGKGTGLGLASAYGIIKNHGGSIEVESEIGKGTTFIIHLPIAPSEDLPTAPHQQGESPRPMPTGKGTILLVDDEDILLETGAEMLKALGYKVLQAKTGQSALAAYRQKSAGIRGVILDMIMPDMGGGVVFDRLKEMNPDIRVLLSSGYSLDGQATDILKRGCNGFIQKPFNLEELSVKLQEIL